MIVNSFSTPDFGVERKRVSLLVLSLIGVDHSPDTLTSAASVLLEHSLTVRQANGETFLEVVDLVIDIGVFRNKASLVELD